MLVVRGATMVVEKAGGCRLMMSLQVPCLTVFAPPLHPPLPPPVRSPLCVRSSSTTVATNHYSDRIRTMTPTSKQPHPASPSLPPSWCQSIGVVWITSIWGRIVEVIHGGNVSHHLILRPAILMCLPINQVLLALFSVAVSVRIIKSNIVSYLFIV